MSEQSLLALATDNEAVVRVVKEAIERYYNGIEKDGVFNMTADGHIYVILDSIPAMVKYAWESAEARRKERDTLIGLAGAAATVTVREPGKTSALQFQTFIIVATCAAGMIYLGEADGSFPEEVGKTYAEAIRLEAEPYFAKTADRTKELDEVAGTAGTAWATMNFPNFPSTRILLH